MPHKGGLGVFAVRNFSVGETIPSSPTSSSSAASAISSTSSSTSASTSTSASASASASTAATGTSASAGAPVRVGPFREYLFRECPPPIAYTADCRVHAHAPMTDFTNIRHRHSSKTSTSGGQAKRWSHGMTDGQYCYFVPMRAILLVLSSCVGCCIIFHACFSQ
jgi:hypothetical protein